MAGKHEKAIIVDSNDNIIGSKLRSEIDYTKDIYRSASLCVFNSNGQILLAQRKLTKDKDPGMWGPAAAGTVEEGETYESNIYKEAEEEIGLSGVKFQIALKHYEDTPRKHFIQWFTCVVDKPVEHFTIEEAEVEKVVWVDKNKFLEDVHSNKEKYVASFRKALPSLL